MDFRVLASCSLAWLLSLGAAVGATKPEAVQCLSALAWQREQDYVKPVNDEAAFRRGPFAYPRKEDAKPLPAALNFPITVSSSVDKAEVELRIAAGVRALHAFADAEAECWFRDAARLDPQCASAWVGLAIANEKLPSRALYFLDKAKAAQGRTPLEDGWVAAYETFFQTARTADLLERLEALSAALRKLAQAQEGHRCAESFALRYRIIRANIQKIPLSDANEVAGTLAKWTGDEGGDALLFYPVLLWLKFDPAKAAQHTRGLAQPDSMAAAWRLAAEPAMATGDYDEAARGMEIALGKARHAPAGFPEQEATTLQYATTLAWCHFHAGKPARALEQARELVELPRKPGFTGLEAVDDAPEGGYLSGLQLRAQLWMATGEWAALADETRAATVGTSEEDGLLVRVHQWYWAVLANAALGRGKEALHAKMELGKVADEIARTPYLTRHANLAAGYVRGAEAFYSLVQGRISPFMKDIAHAPGFVLAPWMSKAGASTAAQALVDEALKEHPASKPLSHIATALRGGPAAVDALVAFSPAYAPAKMYRSVRSAQPEFSLPDKSGAAHQLREFRGKPVLVIFFLGQGCAHCVEQLQKFRPLVGAYAEAGIPIVTIGTDSVAKLEESLGPGPELNPDLPYLILSDEPMAAFKAWKCYDEFLQKPLHGTFLLDGEGGVLWSDISHDPYSQAAFLLGECQRLLKLHGVAVEVVGAGGK